MAVQVPDESAASAATVLETAASVLTTAGVRIERVMTATGFAYRSRAYGARLEQLGARHKRTRPFRPQPNGKAERFTKTLMTEWAHARPYADNSDRLAARPEFLDFYNHETDPLRARRPTPMQVLVNNVRGKRS